MISLNSAFRVLDCNYVKKRSADAGSLIEGESERLRLELLQFIFAEKLHGSFGLLEETTALSDLEEGFRFKIQNESHGDYKITQLSFSYANTLKSQSFVIITEQITAQITAPQLNTIILARCMPKLSRFVLSFLMNSFSLVIKPVTFQTDFLSHFLDRTVQDNKEMGDLELTFHTDTLNGSLQSISVDVSATDISKLSQSGTIMNNLYNHLTEKTAIDFRKLVISRLWCTNLVLLTKEGKMKISADLKTCWNIIDQLYTYVSLSKSKSKLAPQPQLDFV